MATIKEWRTGKVRFANAKKSIKTLVEENKTNLSGVGLSGIDLKYSDY
jgi:hypothetical protein